MQGYWKNPQTTGESLKDGWLYTGDLGYIDKDGFLYVMGRFKSLLIADDGEKYSPEGIEESLIQHVPFIEQCILYNNQNAYTTALIVPDAAAIKSYIRANQIQEDDHLPERFYRESLPESGKIITKEQMAKMLEEYYRARGWDKEGRL